MSRNEAQSSGRGGGLQGNFTGTNDIIYSNYASIGPEIYEGYCMLTYSCCATAIVGTGNITDNPQFVNPDSLIFHLQSTSPCIDTGNPISPLDPDSTRADMGAWYYDQSVQPPAIDVTLTPINPPIQIPASGGSFQFNAAVQRVVGPQASFWVWCRIKNPDGSYTGPTVGPVQINPPVGIQVSRQRTQNIPGTWVPGTYTYLGYANTSPQVYLAIDSSFFSFVKLADGAAGPFIWDATCTGDPFPYEVATAKIPRTCTLVGVVPNPFNPIATINYQLIERSQVRLQVFDVTGRQIVTLVNGSREAGRHEVNFDGTSLPSGVYFYALTTDDYTVWGKMVLMK